MSTYEPGTVAVATVRGVKGVRVFRRFSPDSGICDWAYNPDPARGLNYSCDADAGNVVTDIRPLVVLDLDQANPWGIPEVKLSNLLEQLRGEGATGVCRAVADQIEAQTKPPRIPEPGLYGVVKAHFGSVAGRPWIFARAECGWVCLDDGSCREWSDLIDPVLIREGLS
ncbi:MAG: hypothetical protein ACXVXN_00570 [Mycobacteriaceae bacterium]